MNRKFYSFVRSVIPFAILLFAGIISDSARSSAAETVLIPTAADATLIELKPGNNMGGQLFVNSGRTQNGTRNRGLYKFDLTSIPSGSKITSGTLILECIQEPSEPENRVASQFQLHRVLLPWGEGTKTNESVNDIPISPGQGQVATANEVTWNHRFAFTTNTWGTGGGLAGTDYVTNVTASTAVFGVAESPYLFGPSARLTADLQQWLDRPETNFGWILISASEHINWSARGFGSRENALSPPQLYIDFIPPAPISDARITTNQIQFTFTVEAGVPYAVQSRATLQPAENWTTRTNIPASLSSTNLTYIDTISGSQRFYRVVPE